MAKPLPRAPEVLPRPPAVALLRRAAELHPRRLLPGVAAGAVSGLLTTVLSVSFAALIFSGSLSEHLPAGLGMILISAAVLGVVVAVAGPSRTAVAIPQDAVAAVSALMAASIAARLAGPGAQAQVLPTVVAAIALTACLTGALLLALGAFRLGRLIRYMPYPVVGGFLAGTGWLLAAGGIGIMAGVPLGLETLPLLLEGGALARWLPGLALAGVLLTVMRRPRHPLAVPAVLLATLALFYLALFATGTSVAQASADGWLLGNLAGGGLWPPISLADLSRVNGRVLAEQAGSMVAVAVISAASLLLNATAAELATREDLDVDRELRAAGLGNVAAGLAGGMAGYHALSLSVLSHRMGARGSLAGLVSALLCGAVLLAGGGFLAYTPKPLLGGLLLFLGLSFLAEWVYDGRRRLPRLDYALVLLILAAIAAAGFLQGVALGVLVAVLLFVASYSRVGVIRHALSGTHHQSSVERPEHERRLLQQRGDRLYIVTLQGFLFFGTGDTLLERLRQRLDDSTRPAVRFLLLDFRLVGGIDSSAVLSFAKLRQLAEARGITLVCTQLPRDVRRQLELGGYRAALATPFLVLSDLDHGVQWCEDQLLQAEGAAAPSHPPLAAAFGSAELAARLMPYVERVEVAAGECVVRQGAPADDLFLVLEGSLTAVVDIGDGQRIRVRTMGAGTTVGEVGLYLGTTRTASVIAEEPSVLYRLSRGALERMKAQDPQVAASFHEFVARRLADRLDTSTRRIEALL